VMPPLSKYVTVTDIEQQLYASLFRIYLVP
jgi:hypothetical protein